MLMIYVAMRDEMNNMRAEIARLTHYKEETTERSDLFTGKQQDFRLRRTG